MSSYADFVVEKQQEVADAWEALQRWASKKQSLQSLDSLQDCKKVVICGGGSFGTAMATLLALNRVDLNVTILVRKEAAAQVRACVAEYVLRCGLN
eukprot:scaffold338_cov377-Prasinococcus_capsulatus_cf.AAC.6